MQAVTSQLPKCPVEVGVVPHWLAIDGIQPAIPENMPLERSRVKRARIDKPKAAGVAGASAQPAAAAQGPKPVAAPLGGAGKGWVGSTWQLRTMFGERWGS